MINLLNEEIKSKLATSKGFLIDGYPREKNQGEEFENAVKLIIILLFRPTCIIAIKLLVFVAFYFVFKI